MKNWLLALAVVVGSTMALAPIDADARRFGGGKSSGMQRAAPPPAMPTKPAQATPNAAPNAGAAAAAGKRSWMGPIAGLAAGLGLAALMSHLGLGEQFANMIMLALLAVVAIVAVRWLMRRMGPPQAASRTGDLAAAGPGRPLDAPVNAAPRAEPAAAMQRSADSGAVLAADGKTLLSSFGAPAAAAALPAGFDRDGFERIAKMIFIRMQAANDTGDLNDLRAFTTPEMFAVVKLDLQERGGTGQTTDVVKVDADVLDVAQEGQQQIVSVRFHGQIREDVGAPAADFDEVWHLVRFGDQPNWAISGIQQRQ